MERVPDAAPAASPASAHRQRQEEALGVRRAEEERDWREREQQDGRVGDAPAKLHGGEPVEERQADRQRRQRYDHGGDQGHAVVGEPAGAAHEQWVEGEEHAPAAERLDVRLVAVLRDPQVPEAVPAHER